MVQVLACGILSKLAWACRESKQMALLAEKIISYGDGAR